MSILPNSSQDLKLDSNQEHGFTTYYRSLSQKPNTTIRIFDRSDYYTVHGVDANFVAREIFKSEGVLRFFGQGKSRLEYVVLNKSSFESTIRELLLVRHYRIEVYRPKSSGKNASDWTLAYKASPGNLAQFEDLLYGSADTTSSSGILSVRLATDNNQLTVGVAYVDVVLRRFQICQFVDSTNLVTLESVVVQLGAKECLILPSSDGDTRASNLRHLLERSNIAITERKKAEFDNKDLTQDLNRLLQFAQGSQPNAAILPEMDSVHATAGLAAIIKYLDLLGDETNFSKFTLTTFQLGEFMRLDASAARALNLLPSPNEGSGQCHSLYALLNKCRTAQGQRLLATWLHQPLMDLNRIEERLDVVDLLVSDSELRQSLRASHLRRLPDLQRLSGRLQRRNASLQDCYRVYQAVGVLPELIEALETSTAVQQRPELCAELFCNPIKELMVDFSKFQEMIETTLDLDHIDSHDFLIKADFDDDLRALKVRIDKLESDMKKELIKAGRDLGLEPNKVLKMECNSQLGYFFRVTRKDEKVLRQNRGYQTIDTNKAGVRFRSTALRSLNDDYVQVKSEYTEQQRSIATEVVNIACGYVEPLCLLSDIVAKLDVLTSFAQVSADAPEPYVRPRLLAKGSGKLCLTGVRHPCLELQDSITFIANDIDMNKDGGKSFYIITGPNMGGKSTYIRSIGAVVLLAQLGCFVPCREAELTIVDAILARVGASDSQLKGVSTFMSEMLETATILKSATEHSLIIIDELGRGTSTYDGFGLAWAIAEHVATDVHGFCLFATHFHELTALSETVSSVGNLNVTALTTADTLTLLYRVKPGVCDQSFGIHVAELVHFPGHVIEFARLKALEMEHSMQLTNSSEDGEPTAKKSREDIPDVSIEMARTFLTSLKTAVACENDSDKLWKKLQEAKQAFACQLASTQS